MSEGSRFQVTYVEDDRQYFDRYIKMLTHGFGPSIAIIGYNSLVPLDDDIDGGRLTHAYILDNHVERLKGVDFAPRLCEVAERSGAELTVAILTFDPLDARCEGGDELARLGVPVINKRDVPVVGFWAASRMCDSEALGWDDYLGRQGISLGVFESPSVLDVVQGAVCRMVMACEPGTFFRTTPKDMIEGGGSVDPILGRLGPEERDSLGRMYLSS